MEAVTGSRAVEEIIDYDNPPTKDHIKPLRAETNQRPLLGSARRVALAGCAGWRRFSKGFVRDLKSKGAIAVRDPRDHIPTGGRKITNL